jgi:hypothetical protein
VQDRISRRVTECPHCGQIAQEEITTTYLEETGWLPPRVTALSCHTEGCPNYVAPPQTL